MSKFTDDLRREQDVITNERVLADEVKVTEEASRAAEKAIQADNERKATEGINPALLLGSDIGIALEFLNTMRANKMKGAVSLLLRREEIHRRWVRGLFRSREVTSTTSGLEVDAYVIGKCFPSADPQDKRLLFLCADERVRASNGCSALFIVPKPMPEEPVYEPGFMVLGQVTNSFHMSSDSPSSASTYESQRVSIVDMPLSDVLPRLAAQCIDGSYVPYHFPEVRTAVWQPVG